MKSTFVLFVLWASCCLSATAQATYRVPVKMDQLQKVSIQKEAPSVKPITKKEQPLPATLESTTQKKVVGNYYLPLHSTYRLPSKTNTLHNPTSTSTKSAKQE